MGLRFQKRIRLFKGFAVNLSKTGASFTVGGRGASINVRGGRVTGNVGIPGTGLSYRERLDGEAVDQAVQEVAQATSLEHKAGGKGWKLLAIIFFVAFVVTLLALLGK